MKIYNISIFIFKMSEQEIGECCYCGNECNPCSQSCGMCMRSITGYSIGMNSLPYHLRHVYEGVDGEGVDGEGDTDEGDSDYNDEGDEGDEGESMCDLVSTDEEVDTEEKETLIYYNGLHSDSECNQYRFTETEFRIFLSNIPEFAIPTSRVMVCSLGLLLKATGADVIPC